MSIQTASWIQGDNLCEAPMFRREFNVSALKTAKIEICGLGFFELYINGQRVSDDMFVPAWSNYEPRDTRNMLYPFRDELTFYRTYYMEYDITQYLNEGENALGVMLGNGWYHQIKRVAEGRLEYGFPKLAFSLSVTDINDDTKVVSSDSELKWIESEIAQNNLFYGERHDLHNRLFGWSKVGFDDSAWKPVAQAAAPKDTQLVRQTCPTDKIIRRLTPICCYQDSERKIYDCGENLSGFVTISCPAKSGDIVRVRHSEEVDADCTHLDFTSAGMEKQIQMDEYICAEQPMVAEPKFCWHGFRYFEVVGEAEVIAVNVVHTDVAVTSDFECSNETLNWIFKTYLRTQLANFHCSVPSDCPHRERLGYTGDGQLTAPSAMLCFDSRELYKKWMDDIVDSQDKNNGHIQHTAPYYGGGGGPGGWGGAVYLVPKAYYETYGDEEFLKKYYPNMRLWLDYMEAHTDNGLVVREEEGGWCLGEWCTPKNPDIPPAFINTYYYIKGLKAIQDFAVIIGDAEDMSVIKSRLAVSESAMKDNYFDDTTGSFCNGVNGADAFAISIGLGDERTLQKLVEKYSRIKTFDTGIFGTELLIDVLFENGQADLAFTLLTQETDSSFEHMRKSGATTFWESWDGHDSHNHPMFGGVVRSLFIHILGIKQDGVGYSSVNIKPACIAGLSWAKGHITTANGKIFADYRKGSNDIAF